MFVDYGWEKFYKSLRHAIGSSASLQERLEGVISGVCHLNRDSFPDDESFKEFQTLLKGTTMVPAKGEEGTIHATAAHMKDDEATRWLETAFDLFTKISEAEARL